jgi:ABC-type dipeptide/oligopeptide/nickel transport system permease component
MMICGSSIPDFLLQVNFLQIIVHFMGVLFTTWFVLDTWRYTLLWILWAVFALPAFALELYAIQQSIKLTTDIKKNTRGDFHGK